MQIIKHTLKRSPCNIEIECRTPQNTQQQKGKHSRHSRTESIKDNIMSVHYKTVKTEQTQPRTKTAETTHHTNHTQNNRHGSTDKTSLHVCFYRWRTHIIIPSPQIAWFGDTGHH